MLLRSFLTYIDLFFFSLHITLDIASWLNALPHFALAFLIYLLYWFNIFAAHEDGKGSKDLQGKFCFM